MSIAITIIAAFVVGYYVWDDGTSGKGRFFAVFFWVVGLALEMSLFFHTLGLACRDVSVD
jgi:hypothetical protein